MSDPHNVRMATVILIIVNELIIAHRILIIMFYWFNKVAMCYPVRYRTYNLWYQSCSFSTVRRIIASPPDKLQSYFSYFENDTRYNKKWITKLYNGFDLVWNGALNLKTTLIETLEFNTLYIIDSLHIPIIAFRSMA